MEVFYKYGSKARLFEMMKKVNKLNEQILPREKKTEIINDFIKFANVIELNVLFTAISILFQKFLARHFLDRKHILQFTVFISSNKLIISIMAILFVFFAKMYPPLAPWLEVTNFPFSKLEKILLKNSKGTPSILEICLIETAFLLLFFAK